MEAIDTLLAILCLIAFFIDKAISGDIAVRAFIGFSQAKKKHRHNYAPRVPYLLY